jgi:hypothetical protein
VSKTTTAPASKTRAVPAATGAAPASGLAAKAKENTPGVPGKGVVPGGTGKAGSSDSKSTTITEKEMAPAAQAAATEAGRLITPPAPGLPSPTDAQGRWAQSAISGTQNSIGGDIASQRANMHSAIQDYRNEADVNRKREMWDLIIQNLGKMTAGTVGGMTHLDVGSKFQPTDAYNAQQGADESKTVLGKRLEGEGKSTEQGIANKTAMLEKSLREAGNTEEQVQRILKTLMDTGILRQTVTGDKQGTTQGATYIIPPIAPSPRNANAAVPKVQFRQPQAPEQRKAISDNMALLAKAQAPEGALSLQELKARTRGIPNLSPESVWAFAEAEVNKASAGKPVTDLQRKAGMKAALTRIFSDLRGNYPAGNETAVNQHRARINQYMGAGFGWPALESEVGTPQVEGATPTRQAPN